MTNAERHTEGTGEAIEDLEAPAAALGDVTGGVACAKPTCPGGNTMVNVWCAAPSCRVSKSACGLGTVTILVHEV